MILERMMKEEWRTQSKLYRGGKLALLPFTILILTYLGARLVTNFSTAPITDLGLLISAFGFFTGLAAGSIGFSSNDAAKNVLGDDNFIIFSSRTLPVRKSRLVLVLHRAVSSTRSLCGNTCIQRISDLFSLHDGFVSGRSYFKPYSS